MTPESIELEEKVSALWPSLRFERVGRFDWQVTQYDTETLTALADRYQSAPQRPTDWAVGQLMRDLAGLRAAITNLNKHRETAPQDVRGLNVAAHTLALRRLGASCEDAMEAVAAAWGRDLDTVMDLHRRYRSVAEPELEKLVGLCLSRNTGPQTEEDVMKAVDSDMCVRARLSWFQFRAAAKVS